MALGTKTGGRQKGTPNKTTKELREVLAGFVFEQIEGIKAADSESWGGLNLDKRITLLTKLAPYVFPKVEELNGGEE